MDANVWNFNSSMEGYAAQIEQTGPDLLTLEEATPYQVGQLVESGSLKGLPYRFEVYRPDQKAFLVASKYPLSDTQLVFFEYEPLIVQVVVHLPSGNQDLWVVHTSAPLPGVFTQWKGQLAAITQRVQARGPQGLLLVGDFNATWGSKGFRTILGAGMTDAAAARGHAFDMTWTQSHPPLPPIARIDHVLTGPGVAVTTIQTDVGPGSDHRDLHATIAIERS
jgi:endonuclease/exonuclease/phosphatase (EEP) superfamily protein YafD